MKKLRHLLNFRFVKNMKFDVRFTFSRFPLRNMHRALEIVGQGQTNWKNWLFPDPISSNSKYSGKSSSSNLNLKVGQLMEGNLEQKLAVSIFSDSSRKVFIHSAKIELLYLI